MQNPTTNDQVDVNAKLLKADWIAEIDAGVKHMVAVIKRVFRPDGLLGIIADPFIDLAAVAFLKSSRRTGIKQMNITIQCAKECIETGIHDATIQKHSNRFVDLDEMFVYGNKTHPRFKDLEKSIREEFALRVEETTWLLSAKPWEGCTITGAPDIYKIAYNNDIEKAKKVHAQELGFIEDRLRMVREYEGLIEIPFGLRDKVLQVIAEGMEFTKERYQQVFRRWFS
ncbi:MAG: hypothetical protein Q6373_002265 [Candidatus Sigynarchaeota archaeon]